MRVQAKIADTFSPYMDPAPMFDTLEDYRGAMAASFALLLHTAIFITFSMTVFLLPPKIIEPEVIPIRIIAAPAKEEPAPAPPPPETILTPAAPSPKPAPKPRPAPPPPPVTATEPLPMPEMIETPEPEPVPALPPPVLADTAPPAPDETALAEPKLVDDDIRAAAIARMQERFEAQNRPDPVPEPIIETPVPEPEVIPEFIPEVIPEIVPEVIPEIIPEPLPEPIAEPAPIEPVYEPIIIEPVPEPDPQIEIFEQVPEPEIIPEIIIDAPLPPDAVIPDAAPGAIIEEPIEEPFIAPPIFPVEPEPIVIEPAPPAPVPSEPEPITPDPAEDIAAPAEPLPVITDAPKVLADSEAPETAAERQRAVDKSQAATSTPSRPAGGGGRQYTTPTIGGGGGGSGQPLFGGGNTAPPPSGAPSRGRPGAGGSWTLSPGTQGDAPSGGLGGIKIDMRCRDRFRTHEDCPEYIPKPQGRGTDGYESFSPHSIAGSGRGGPPRTRVVGQSANPLGSDYSTHNNNGPSTSVLDDAGFERTFRNNPITVGRPQSDLSGLFGNAPSGGLDLRIKDTPEASEGEDPWALTEEIKP